MREFATSKGNSWVKKRNDTNHTLANEYNRTARLLFTIKQDNTFRSIAFAICRLLGSHKPLIFLATANRIYLKTRLHPSVLLYIFKAMNIKEIPNNGDDEAAFSSGVQAVAKEASKKLLKHRRYLKAIRRELAEG